MEGGGKARAYRLFHGGLGLPMIELTVHVTYTG